jgi:hypothetical protein
MELNKKAVKPWVRYVNRLSKAELRTALIAVLKEDGEFGYDSLVGYQEAEEGDEDWLPIPECLYWRTTGENILE